jgi:N-methylhydantoinase A
VERGRDPRNFNLLCFGGAGSLHAVAIAQALQIKRVIVSPHSGIFSAYGLLFADIERNYVHAFMRVFDESASVAMDDLFRSMTKEAIQSAERWGYKGAKVQIDRYADLRYYRQTSEITIPIFDDELIPQRFSVIRKRFDEQHEKNYDFSLPESSVQVINLRIVARISRPRPALPERIGVVSKPSQHDLTQQRKAYFGKKYGSVIVPVVSPEQLGQNATEGPLIVESYDTTILIPHDCSATVGPAGTIIIDIRNEGELNAKEGY